MIRLAPSTGAAERLMILLHGVGANAEALRPLGEAFASALPGLAVVLPDGVEPHDGGGPGRQWFSVTGITSESRFDRVRAARPGFDATMQTILTAEGFAERMDRVVIAGFSQGAIMTFDAVASRRWAPSAAIGFSGRMATADRPAGPASTRVLLVHGEADPVIPPGESRTACELLAAEGFAAELVTLPGVGHAVDPAGFRRAVRFLTEE